MIDLAARRLQKVIIENKDFEKLIRQYDRSLTNGQTVSIFLLRSAVFCYGELIQGCGI